MSSKKEHPEHPKENNHPSSQSTYSLAQSTFSPQTSQEVIQVPLGEFLSSLVSTLLNNQEVIMKKLEKLEYRQVKVEKRITEIK